MTPMLQISARGPHAACQMADAAFEADPELEAAAWSMIEEDEARGVWRIDAYPADESETRAFATQLAATAGLAVTRETLADADWVALSLSGLPPVRAGRFFVYGAHDAGAVPLNAIALRIEAGAAFGTGHHGTTAGCLATFDALLKGRCFRRVLDVGTGTGVLAIAAARCGATRVIGTDLDPVAVRVAAANAALNRCGVRFVCANGLAHSVAMRSAPYDLVFANILARPLIALSRDIGRVMNRGGVVILSGLLRSQARAVRAAYVGRGFHALMRLDVDAWTTLALARRD